MARILSLRKTEQVVAELEQRVSRLTQQLSTVASSCREIFDSMEAIEHQWRRLPTADSLQQRATAAEELARALHDAR
jgi:methyl-accepting chemotaxis protein